MLEDQELALNQLLAVEVALLQQEDLLPMEVEEFHHQLHQLLGVQEQEEAHSQQLGQEDYKIKKILMHVLVEKSNQPNGLVLHLETPL